MDSFLQEIDREITQGLPHAHGKLHQARINIQTYMGNFKVLANDDFLRPWHFSDHRTETHLLLMQRVVDSLTSNLYKNPPTRSLNDDRNLTEFLTKVYNHNRMDALWGAADKMVHAADEFAFQFVGTDDPKNPIRVHGWHADNFLVYTDPEDVLRVVAVVTIDLDRGRERFRLYTEESVVTYVTEEPLPGSKDRGLPRRVAVETNPYLLPSRPGSKEMRGVIPFSFVHMNVPTVSWYAGGPGTILSEMNSHVNYKLGDLSDAMRYSRPIATLEGTHPNFVPPKWTRMGDWLNLPAEESNSRGEKTMPRLNYTAPPLDFVDKELDYINKYVDLQLQTVGVPPATIRLVPSSVKSGAAIVAEHIPLLLYAKNRQKSMQYYEHDAAYTLFQVCAAHYRANGRPELALEAALTEFNLVIKWGEVYPDLPGPDRDNGDKFLLENGLTSKIEVLKRRNDWSDEEAAEFLEKIAADEALEKKLRTEYELDDRVEGGVGDSSEELDDGDASGGDGQDKSDEDTVNDPY